MFHVLRTRYDYGDALQIFLQLGTRYGAPRSRKQKTKNEKTEVKNNAVNPANKNNEIKVNNENNNKAEINNKAEVKIHKTEIKINNTVISHNNNNKINTDNKNINNNVISNNNNKVNENINNNNNKVNAVYMVNAASQPAVKNPPFQAFYCEIHGPKSRHNTSECRQKSQKNQKGNCPQIDITETLTALTIAARNNLEVHHATITKTYDPIYYKNLGLNNVPNLKGFEWFCYLRDTLFSFGWVSCPTFPCTYKMTIGSKMYYILTYVYDLLIIGPDLSVIMGISNDLRECYEVKDNGEVSSIWGFRITRNRAEKSFTLDKSAYISKILKKFNIKQNSNFPCRRSIYDFPEEAQCCPYDDPTDFRSKIGSLVYLSRFTCPSITFAVNFLSHRASFPSVHDSEELDRILQYLRQNKDSRLIIKGTSLNPWEIRAFSDADFAEDCQTSQSVSGHAIFIGDSLVAWGSKRQDCVALSTTESDYIAMNRCAKKAAVVSHLLEFLEKPASVRLFCDNQATIAAIKRVGRPYSLKHINLEHHRIKELIRSGYSLDFIPSKSNVASIMIRPLKQSLHESLRAQMNIGNPNQMDSIHLSLNQLHL